MAAGSGSRYGKLKQFDELGPKGDFLLEFSIYDAINNGFKHIVLVTKKENKDFLNNYLINKIPNHIKLDVVIQDINDLPKDTQLKHKRIKPWGTAHAVWSARHVIKSSFVIINADDYYGANSFKIMADFLSNECSPSNMSMLGYILENTLSENGTVNRGVCEVDSKNNLVEVNEREKLAIQGEKVEYNIGSDEPSGEVDPKSYVSMNYWGFHPSIFKDIEEGLHSFMKENRNSPTAEYYIPNIVSDKIKAGEIAFAVIPTNDNWFGVTYKEDKQMAIDTLNKHIENGVYPKKLWS